VYVSLADQLVGAGRLAEGQEVLGMLKEEELYDYVARGGEQDVRGTVATFVGAAEAAAQVRWETIRGQVAEIAREAAELDRKAALGLSADEQARRRQLDADLVLVNQRYDVFVTELSRDFAAAGARRAEALGARQLRNLVVVQDLLAEFGRDAALLHYVVADQRVAIIMTTADVQVGRETRIPAAELNRKVLAFRQALAARTDVTAAARELYRILLGPVQADLQQAGARTLLLSLDGTLRYLPFAALHDGRGWLTERYAVALYTEAARVQLARAPRRQWTMTGLGLTHAVPGFAALPAVREELEGLRRRALPGEVFLDEQFTADRLRTSLAAGRPVVHIASHFQFRPGTYAQSFLVLGDGARLSLQDIRDRRLRFANVDLLTLSACDTAMGGGADETGAEVEGFGALAQQQGAAAVLATLWPVADGSTSLFMQSVYSRRQADPSLSKAEALRQAQISFLRPPKGGGRTDPRHTHPFYWAPYVLMGNWR
jgi:CHAT domain-containing protein